MGGASWFLTRLVIPVACMVAVAWYTYDDEIDLPPNCTLGVIESCEKLSSIKRQIASAPSVEHSKIFQHKLQAVRAVRAGNMQKAARHFLKYNKPVRKAFTPFVQGGVAGDDSLLWEQHGSQSPDGSWLPIGSFRVTTHEKLQHDIEQFEYLIENGIFTREQLESEIVQYKKFLPQIPAMSNHRTVLSPHGAAQIGNTYSRYLHIPGAPRLPGPAVNPRLNLAAIEKDYYKHAPGATYFDDFLVPDALAGLQRFCLESTMWFDGKWGYFGAYVQDGFSAELLFQVADEVSANFPNIFRGQPLTGLWAYKYAAEHSRGIQVHADMAYVNVNFWITPDSANLDPEKGGLVVYHGMGVPMSVTGKDIQDIELLKGLIADNDLPMMRVPHRQNRMVFFNSNLIHATDTLNFRPGYENRRINITMLFGQRRSDSDHAPNPDWKVEV